MNNSPIPHCPNDPTRLVVRLFAAAALLAVSCGCHYCPYNRYTPCRGYRYACDDLGRMSTSGFGGPRYSRFYGDARCDQGECLANERFLDDGGGSYGHEPQPVEVAPDLEVPTDSQQPEPMPVDTTEAFPLPPTAPNDSTLGATPFPDSNFSPLPLFEGRLNNEELEPAPEALVLPQAPLPSDAPSRPPLILEQDDVVEFESEETEEEAGEPSSSLFPLKFPPRLFRLFENEEEAEEEMEVVEPTTPTIEASMASGARVIGGDTRTRFGHSRYSR